MSVSQLQPYKEVMPTVPYSVFVADTARIIGDVTLGDDCSVWYSCVLRGDVNDIKIGHRTNIQDGSVIHTTYNLQGTYIGDDVTVGHLAMLHACNIGSRVLVGMHSTILDGATMEDDSMLAAGSLLTPNKTVPSGHLWGGSPARYMRDLTPSELEWLSGSAKHYVALSREYL